MSLAATWCWIAFHEPLQHGSGNQALAIALPCAALWAFFGRVRTGLAIGWCLTIILF
jgi:hypothetical protein